MPLPPAEPLRARCGPHDEIRCAYYLRFSVKDEPGVLARIASTPRRAPHLHRRGAAARAERPGPPVPLVIVTHEAREADLRAAIAEIDRYPTTLAPTRLIRIEAA